MYTVEVWSKEGQAPMRSTAGLADFATAVLSAENELCSKMTTNPGDTAYVLLDGPASHEGGIIITGFSTVNQENHIRCDVLEGFTPEVA